MAADRRRASRIKTGAVSAVDVPLPVLRLLARGSAAGRRALVEAIGPASVAALDPPAHRAG